MDHTLICSLKYFYHCERCYQTKFYKSRIYNSFINKTLFSYSSLCKTLENPTNFLFNMRFQICEHSLWVDQSDLQKKQEIMFSIVRRRNSISSRSKKSNLISKLKYIFEHFAFIIFLVFEYL